MSRGHGAAQRFVLECAREPLGVTLDQLAARWAAQKGWKRPESLGETFHPSRPPAAAYESMRRAAWSLCDQGLVAIEQSWRGQSGRGVTMIQSLERLQDTRTEAGTSR
jgi:hypothetical protein